jgi:chemotaxis protein MotB
MSRRKKHAGGGHGGGGERWLLTYADLITLLLAFFVILFAMSSTDKHKFDEVSTTLRSAFHVTSGGSNHVMPPGSDKILPTNGNSILPEMKALDALGQQLKERIVQEHGSEAEQKVSTVLSQRGLVITLANSAFFNPGDAVLRPEARSILKTIAWTLLHANRDILIEGHSDNTPIRNPMYPSNWELSTARSTQVVRTLIQDFAIKPTRLSAAGYGEYYPVAPNNNEYNRAKNRRVDIVILRSDYKSARPGIANR